MKRTTKGTKKHEMEEPKLLFHREVGMILDAAIEVHRVLGHGLLEKPYENALAHELRLREIPFVQQPRFQVDYKGHQVGEFIPDLVVFEAIVVDTKTIHRIGDVEVAQMINYLRLTELRVGFHHQFQKPSSRNQAHCPLIS